MIKRNNKGFTLLELIISIFILTTVIFLGYKVINKSTMYIKHQVNIHKGQLNVNDMNEYLTKDLEQASSIVLFVGDKKIIDTSIEEQETLLTNEQLEQELTPYLPDTKNSLSTYDKVTYSYNIRFKEDEESENDTYSRIYSVEIIKDDKDNYRYSVSRKETDGISISFITNEILKQKRLPFIIEGNSPYEVTLGYTRKDNEEFVQHQFVVTSRLLDISINEDNDGDGNNGTGGSGDSSSDGKPGIEGDEVESGPSNNYLWYCLEMAKKSFEEAYKSVSDENIKNDLINIISPIINISKTNPLDKNKYNEISEQIGVLNNKIEKLLGSAEGCLSNEDKYEVFEILKKGKNYLDVAQKTIEESPDRTLPDPPNNNYILNNYINNIKDFFVDKTGSYFKNKIGNVKAPLESNTKYKLQAKNLLYIGDKEINDINHYFQNSIYKIIKDDILSSNVKVNSESERDNYNKNIYTCINNINKLIESIIHVQFELEKVIKVLDDDVAYQRKEIIECANELTILNEKLVIIKGYLEQATYKDEKIEIYEDIFGEHSHENFN